MHAWGAAASHIGHRTRNEDASYVDCDSGFFVVADGMGGHSGGDVAARLIVNSMATTFRTLRRNSSMKERMGAVFDIANAAVRRKQRGALRDMGATVVAMCVQGGTGMLAHVGDSRAYRLRGGRIERLTRDHSYVEMMRAAGMAAPHHLAHIVTRAVGRTDATPELRAISALPGDVFLLCTDGVSDVVPDAHLRVLLDRAYHPCTTAESIVARAIAVGGHDNATAVVVRID